MLNDYQIYIIIIIIIIKQGYYSGIKCVEEPPRCNPEDEANNI